MKIKKGVDPTGIRAELNLALMVADSVWLNLGQELVVTSINDSRHSQKSLHWSGQAADLRTRYFVDNGAKAKIELEEALPDDYDVVLESNHIHLEWQPKK